ncbi:hypothetical protein ACLD9W_12420, partial [Neisseria sp. WLZKY-1]|uniref:hypothetical protein n=1 Tax=Neisseria sp. WLZKY-1 TaxID=3390377 RepID=UPI00397951D9
GMEIIPYSPPFLCNFACTMHRPSERFRNVIPAQVRAAFLPTVPQGAFLTPYERINHGKTI